MNIHRYSLDILYLLKSKKWVIVFITLQKEKVLEQD